MVIAGFAPALALRRGELGAARTLSRQDLDPFRVIKTAGHVFQLLAFFVRSGAGKAVARTHPLGGLLEGGDCLDFEGGHRQALAGSKSLKYHCGRGIQITDAAIRPLQGEMNFRHAYPSVVD